MKFPGQPSAIELTPLDRLFHIERFLYIATHNFFGRSHRVHKCEMWESKLILMQSEWSETIFGDVFEQGLVLTIM